MKNGLNFNKDKYNLAIVTTTSLVLGTAPFTLNANANEVCTVSNLNQLQIAAGAINSYYQNSFEIQNVTFFNNSASTGAGAISADNYGDHEIVFSTFLDNEV